ncbi:hypothetical protein [Streptomyces sp. NPDC006510]|uniref:hypothetical protein n=1 Tax=Streptomyces sp. NPDC006510 TaxID=3155600 RepID=UPI0033B0BD9A
MIFAYPSCRPRHTVPTCKKRAISVYLTPFTLSAKQGATEQAEAAHIRRAFLVPQDAKPYMSAKKVPGQTAKDPLRRAVNRTRSDKNRAAAVKQCKRYWGPGHRPADCRARAAYIRGACTVRQKQGAPLGPGGRRERLSVLNVLLAIDVNVSREARTSFHGKVRHEA